MKSYEMNRPCPGCGNKHVLYYKGLDTPSNLDPLLFTCPSDNKQYVLKHLDLPVWKEEFSIPEKAIIAKVRR